MAKAEIVHSEIASPEAVQSNKGQAEQRNEDDDRGPTDYQSTGRPFPNTQLLPRRNASLTTNRAMSAQFPDLSGNELYRSHDPDHDNRNNKSRSKLGREIVVQKSHDLNGHDRDTGWLCNSYGNRKSAGCGPNEK
jgi:hypothetical protein